MQQAKTVIGSTDLTSAEPKCGEVAALPYSNVSVLLSVAVE